MSKRFTEYGDSIHFHKGAYVHKSFANKYRGMTLIQAARKMKRLTFAAPKYIRREYIHYLKVKGYIHE
jgi:hypothetical protein